MISTSVCRLCRVHLFSVIGIEHEWNPRISAVLDIAVQYRGYQDISIKNAEIY